MDHTFKEHCIGAGGSVENIRIAASKNNYATRITYCPDKENKFHLAKIELKDKTIQTDGLYPFIKKSWSSRFKMTNKKLAQEDIKRVLELVDEYKEYFRIQMVTDKSTCLKLAKLSANAETMNWSLKSTQSKHRSFLKFSRREMKNKKEGIGVWEFGMPLVFGPIAKILTKWNIYKFLVPLGLAKYVGWSARMKKGKKVNNFSVLVLKEREDVKRWLIGGELLQKMLLTTTGIGIDHQWFSSLYIWDDVVNGLGDITLLNKKYKNRALKYSSQIRELLALKNNDFVLAALALGYCNKPGTIKYRRELEKVLTVLN